MQIKQNKIKNTVFFIILYIFIVANINTSKAESQIVDSALFYFKIDKQSYFDPDHLYVDVILNASSTKYNLLDFEINYDSNILSIASSTISTSTCPLVILNSTNEANENHYLACGNPEAITDTVKITTIKFNKLNTGLTNLNFNYGNLFLSSSKGQRIKALTESHNIFIAK